MEAAPGNVEVRTPDPSTLVLVRRRSGGEARLVVDVDDPQTWVLESAQDLGVEDAAVLGPVLGARAAQEVELLVEDATGDDPRCAAAEAGGWTRRAGKVVVARDLEELGDLGSDLPDGWEVTTFAEVGLAPFAAQMVQAAEGDPFDVSTPETAADDLEQLVTAAGAAFDPTAWLLVSDADGPVGVVLPQVSPDDPTGGTVAYVAVVPRQRGAGVGRILHRRGLELLRERGVRHYVGSTDDRNAPMLSIFRRNGARVCGTQTFFNRTG